MPYIFYLRYNKKPQAGKSKGLVLVLDAHSDLVTASSVPNDFQVNNAIIKKMYFTVWNK